MGRGQWNACAGIAPQGTKNMAFWGPESSPVQLEEREGGGNETRLEARAGNRGQKVLHAVFRSLELVLEGGSLKRSQRRARDIHCSHLSVGEKWAAHIKNIYLTLKHSSLYIHLPFSSTEDEV